MLWLVIAVTYRHSIVNAQAIRERVSGRETHEQSTSELLDTATQDAYRYTIAADVDPIAHSVHGSMQLVWVNRSTKPIDQLHLHLYLNAFADQKTVFMAESGGHLRNTSYGAPGSIEILELRTGQHNLLTASSFRSETDHTELAVRLPQAVPPGGRVDIRSEFVSRLPRVFARSGYSPSGFHMVSQWFPKVAKLEPDGSWETFPYHGNGEFYADFCSYDVTVRVPSGWEVASTGASRGVSIKGNAREYRFLAERVHDFAFAAWDDFTKRSKSIDGVSVWLFSPPAYDRAAERILDVVTFGLRFFGDHYGPYPYSHLTVVHVPEDAKGAGGMEYPTLFTVEGPRYSFDKIPFLHDEVTAHETAHQWFQGMIATHEVRWPMLDEGIANWAHRDLVNTLHHSNWSGVRIGNWGIDTYELLRSWSMRFYARAPAPGNPAYAFSPAEYNASVYGRTSLVLETIARTWGVEKLRLALGRYARRYRWAHPTPDSLFAEFDAVYWNGFSASFLIPALMHGETASARMVRFEVADGGTTLEVERVGSLPIPLDIELVEENGDSIRVHWPPNQTHLSSHLSNEHFIEAHIDPDNHNLLDDSTIDNHRTSKQHDASPALFAIALKAFQDILFAFGP